MSTQTIPQASCLCEGIKLNFSGPPDKNAATNCFCKYCSKNSGAPYSTLIIFDQSVVSVEDPENLMTIYSMNGTDSGKPKPKSFCSRCGVTLFEQPAIFENKMVIRTSLFDGGAGLFPPALEIYTKDRPAFVKAVDGAKQCEIY
ncbi:hypothetical protein RUND412_009047 [Rhizina undulata]